jgi:hypothetical protein
LSLEAAGLQNAFHNRMKVQRAVQDMRDSGRAAGTALEAVKKHGAASGVVVHQPVHPDMALLLQKGTRMHTGPPANPADPPPLSPPP